MKTIKGNFVFDKEENREKRENEVLSVIEIVDDDTKLAS